MIENGLEKLNFENIEYPEKERKVKKCGSRKKCLNKNKEEKK